MPRPIVILHGWSDTSDSFKDIGTALHTDTVQIFLGNYISLDDQVTVPDLATALSRIWVTRNLPTTPRSVDVIVHSTGALVIREWMTRFFTPETNPVFHLVMLAPANFGSPIAHVGRSMLGRVLKGFSLTRPLETGTKILKSLELASPYSWRLAERDLLGTGAEYYGPKRVLSTVLVGTEGYTGIRAAANKRGGDGTVYVSTANINCQRVTLDFSKDPQHPEFSLVDGTKSSRAFARISKENHSTIVSAFKKPSNPETPRLIRQALTVADENFVQHCQDMETFCEQERLAGNADRHTHGYQNTVIRVRDHLGATVPDFFLELFCKQGDDEDTDLTEFVQTKVVESVHPYGDDPSYRSLLINTTALHSAITDAGHTLFVSVSAMPDVHTTDSVGYSTIAFDDIGSIRIDPDDQRILFQPDRTVLIDLVLHREQADNLMQLLDHP